MRWWNAPFRRHSREAREVKVTSSSLPQPLRGYIIGWNCFQRNCQLVWAFALPHNAAGPCKTLLEYSKVFDFRRSTWHKQLVKTPSSTEKRAPCYDMIMRLALHSLTICAFDLFASCACLAEPLKGADEPKKTTISSHRRKNIAFLRLIFTRCHSSSCRSCGKG